MYRSYCDYLLIKYGLSSSQHSLGGTIFSGWIESMKLQAQRSTERAEPIRGAFSSGTLCSYRLHMANGLRFSLYLYKHLGIIWLETYALTFTKQVFPLSFVFYFFQIKVQFTYSDKHSSYVYSSKCFDKCIHLRNPSS